MHFLTARLPRKESQHTRPTDLFPSDKQQENMRRAPSHFWHDFVSVFSESESSFAQK